jgi:hypothetical protein
VRFERVAVTPTCAECHAVWLPDEEERWRAYFDCDYELHFFCPDCAEREFDGD